MNEQSKINVKIKWNGDSAITLFFNEQADVLLTRYILTIAQKAKENYSDNLIDVIPAYQSLTLCFDVLSIDIKTVEDSINEIIKEQSIEELKAHKANLIEIPVCYDEAHAPDLASLAKQCKLDINDVIALHTQEDYLVNMLGFLPGFLYLSGLDKRLYCPRKNTPSLKVPAGAVGIGGNQTGIYPVESPGGWHIIGRTPISIFTPVAENPFVAQPLDRIRFIAIDMHEYEKLCKEY